MTSLQAPTLSTGCCSFQFMLAYTVKALTELMGAANLLGVAICVITDQPEEGCDVWLQPHATVGDDV